MKKLHELVSTNQGENFLDKKKENSYCHSGVMDVINRLFKIPGGTKKIWVQLWDEPSPNRWKLIVKKMGKGDDYPIAKVVGTNVVINNPVMDEILNKFMQKSVWLQVQYEE
jgi:hypothetical protein